MSWHSQSVRPLTSADVGRFVVGHGLPGWVSGYLERMHGDYLVIDTGRSAGALNGNIVADALQIYTFVDVPSWANA